MTAARFRSLTFRLTGWYVVLLALLTALFLGFLYEHSRADAQEDLNESLHETAGRVAALWQRRGVTWAQAVAGAEEELASRKPLILIVGFEGHEGGEPRELARSSGLAAGRFLMDRETYRRAEDTGRDGPLVRTVRDPALAAAPIRVLFLETRDDAIIQVGLSTERLAADLRRLAILLILAGALFLALASAGGGLIIRRALHPVTSVVQAARRISAEDLSLRIDPPRRRDEIGDLVETFNAMIARLDESVGRIRRFSADVSHELRTPLTIIRGEIEVVLRKDRTAPEYRAVLESALEESHRMEAIIDDLLLLARIGASKVGTGMSSVRLADVASRVADARTAAAGRRGVAITVRAEAPGTVDGDASLLERLAANLVDNAVRFTAAGGHVGITITESDGRAVLTVADDGIGIPAEALPRIFDRFFVVDSARSKEHGGVGLGLSIVKSVAERYGAAIDVRSEVGRGTVFTIRFPLAAPPSAEPES